MFRVREGYSITLRLWYYVSFLKKIVLRSLTYPKYNKGRHLILINVINFIVVVINYCAALTVVTTGNMTDKPTQCY